MGSYYLPPSGSQINQAEKYGHPGLFYASLDITDGTTDFTGSNYGYNAVWFESQNNSHEVHLTGGGVIAGNVMKAREIYRVSLRKVVAAGSNKAYALKVKDF